MYSLASVDAMSYGVPVFSGINPELYQDGCPVVYPRERTAQSIANELNTILDWNILREHSERSFEWCKEVHGQMGEKWVKVYRELTK